MRPPQNSQYESTKNLLTGGSTRDRMVVMNYTDEQIRGLKMKVLAAGARWVGIQPSLAADLPDLVLFQSEKTSTTLAVPVDDCTISAVQERILASNGEFENARILVPRKMLLNIMQTLRTSADAIEDFTRKK